MCCYRMLVLLLLCLAPPGIAMGFQPDTENREPVYYLDQLAIGLKNAPGPVRADLAYTAISELAAAFTEESRLAREEIRRQPGQRKLRRWAVAVENLAFELDDLAQTVTSQSSVQVVFGPGKSLYLVVDDKPVVVSGPRSKDQADLEKRIVSRFCSLHPCSQLVPEPLTSEALPVPDTSTATTRWSFSEDAGPVCSTDDGLVFQFDNASDLRRKREACARVVTELHLLAAQINQRKGTGTRVKWKAVEISTLPLGVYHEIQLNDEGDTLNLYVPALASAPDLFLLLRPWLAANVSGVNQPVMISNAETLLPPVGFMGQ
jgi:hypothetical protein